MNYKHILFDWGNTLMVDNASHRGPMCDWDQVEAIAGAQAVLEILSQTIPCHVATNAGDSAQSDIRRALDRVDLGQYITHIFCSNELGYAKPSKKFYDRILEALACQGEDVLMIGDHLENDVIGAIKSGLNAIWLRHSPLTVPPGIRTIDALIDLLKI